MSANLLSNRTLRAFLTSGLYPAVFQAITAAFFVLVVYQLLVGPTSAHDNLGTALTWVLWWPMIPIVFVVLGRFWCAICPFGTVSDLVQRLAGQRRPVPAFLKKYGIWIIDGLFILITWADHVWGIVASPLGSAMLLLALTTGVVVSGAFFVRRTWCRYLCFLGGLAGNYARSGMVALRANAEICATCKARAACYNGNEKGPGCPMFEFPRQMESNARCTLCAACIKTCPNDAITITMRPPTQELWFIRNPKFEESFLAIVIMGIVLVQNVTMLEIWNSMLQALEQVTGTDNYAVNFTVTFLIAMAIPLGLYIFAVLTARQFNRQSFVANFAKFGYAIIPLDVAGHMAHNLFHLLAEGKSVAFTAQALLGQPVSTESAALLPASNIQVLQYGLLGLGLAGSLYSVRAIARAQYAPAQRSGTVASYGVLVGVFLLVNLWLFSLPMSMRMHGAEAHSHSVADASHAHTAEELSQLHDDVNGPQPHSHADTSAVAPHMHDDSNATEPHTHDESSSGIVEPACVDEPEPAEWPHKINIDAIFPPGEGRDLVLWNCMNCHTFVRIVTGHHNHSHGGEAAGTDTHWDVHRNLHRARLWRLSEAELDVLYAYLKANFNDSKPEPRLPCWLGQSYW